MLATAILGIRDMSLPLDGRIALITGAARGIGAGCAEAFAAAGAHVLALGRSAESLEPVRQQVQSSGGKISCEVVDLAKGEMIAALARSIRERFGKLDILVGNAAILGNRWPLSRTDIADWQAVITVNLTANVLLIRWLDELLQKSDAPRAVFMTALSAQEPRVNGGAYSVAKAGIESMARMYAAENAGRPLRVNVFSPGPVRTTMRAAVAPDEDPMSLDTPAQVAQKIVSICLPEVTETGKLYSYTKKRFMSFQMPIPA